MFQYYSCQRKFRKASNNGQYLQCTFVMECDADTILKVCVYKVIYRTDFDMMVSDFFKARHKAKPVLFLLHKRYIETERNRP